MQTILCTVERIKNYGCSSHHVETRNGSIACKQESDEMDL